MIKIQSSSHKNSQIVTPKLNQNKKRRRKEKIDRSRSDRHGRSHGWTWGAMAPHFFFFKILLNIWVLILAILF